MRVWAPSPTKALRVRIRSSMTTEWRTNTPKYSVDKANQHLDAAGLTKKDAQGFRLDNEGNRISFPIDVLTTMPLQIDALERIKVYWAAVGIDMQVRPVEQSLAFARLQSNDEDALVWIGGGGYDQLRLLDPKWYVPFSKNRATRPHGVCTIRIRPIRMPKSRQPSSRSSRISIARFKQPVRSTSKWS